MRHICLIALALLVPALASAQVDPRDVKLRNDCRLAAQVLTTGNPAVHLRWAASKIRVCPGGGDAVAASILGLRTSRDTALLNTVSWPASEIRDRRIHDAALSIFVDKAASPEARIFAIRSLVWLFSPATPLDYSMFLRLDEGGARCIGPSPPVDLSLTRGELLPSGWAQAIHVAARAVREDESDDPIVRDAATCLLMYRRPSTILQRYGFEDADG
jgi:hypothetical protein